MRDVNNWSKRYSILTFYSSLPSTCAPKGDLLFNYEAVLFHVTNVRNPILRPSFLAWVEGDRSHSHPDLILSTTSLTSPLGTGLTPAPKSDLFIYTGEVHEVQRALSACRQWYLHIRMQRWGKHHRASNIRHACLCMYLRSWTLATFSSLQAKPKASIKNAMYPSVR